MVDTPTFDKGFADTERWRAWCRHMLAPAALELASWDLFCGAGGLGLGMAATGLHGIAVDIDEDSLISHQTNVTGSTICASLSTSTDWHSMGPAEIIMGGPPCQPFSASGKQKGTDDPRNGFPAFVSAVQAMRPRVAVAENVRGVLYRNRAYFDEVAESLRYLGYAVDVRILRADHYGVPQKRERVFMAAWRAGSWEWPTPFVDHPVSCGVALGVGMMHPKQGGRMLTDTMDRYIAKYEQASSCKCPRDLHPNRVARTLTTRNLASATSDMIRCRLEGGGRRMLTLQEGALLQGFPDDFRFSGKDASIARQIGNAVPPLMGLAVARSALRTALG